MKQVSDDTQTPLSSTNFLIFITEANSTSENSPEKVLELAKTALEAALELKDGFSVCSNCL